ncbi:MAG: ABC transporter substrate-binding protein [Bacteroidota bacterium]
MTTKNKSTFLLLLLFFLSCCTSKQTSSNEVRVRFPTDPESLNPINYQTSQALQILNLLFQSLLTVDYADNTLKPMLVEGLPTITKQDSLTLFTYDLRKEAVWDDGSPVTAQDVAFTMKVMLCPLVNNENIRMRYEPVRDVKADPNNAKRLTIVCAGFSPDMMLLTGDFSILPAATFDPKHLLAGFTIPQLISHFDSLSKDANIKAFADFFNDNRFTHNGTALRGSGGYILEDWKTGQSLKLTKKAHWWAESLTIPYITAEPSQISFSIIPDNTTALLALKNDQIDVLDNISVSDYARMQTDANIQARFALLSPKTYDITLLGMNARLEKLADRKTRQAIAMMLDVDNIIKATEQGYAQRTVGMVSPHDTLHYNQAIVPYPYDLEKAAALLREAGWQQKNGHWQKEHRENIQPLTLNLQYRTGDPAMENLALIFQESAKKLGIPVELQAEEGRLLLENRKTRSFELYLRKIGGNPFSFNYKSLFHTEAAGPNGRNDTNFGTAESDSLIEAINQASDVQTKANLIKRFQAVMHEECNVVFLYNPTLRLVVSKRFTNLKISGLLPGYDISSFKLGNL